MDIERERGITIKAKAVTLRTEKDGETYLLNLIDTPGHVDFSYEVSRTLQACEGAILLVDASQGVEAQTIANAYLAIDNDLHILPVLNKVDMANARPREVAAEIETSLGLDASNILEVSAKTGQGVSALLDAVLREVPPPRGDPDASLRALIFDSTHDEYRGVVCYVRVVDGGVRPGVQILMLGTGRHYEVEEVGIFTPKPRKLEELRAGEVGYVIAGIKALREIKVGDTITERKRPATTALPGYKEPLPMVFCGLYPTMNTDFERLREALDKLQLNDSAFTYTPETSGALGFGFRCGFLGLLHMDVVQERLERESGVEIVQTAPNVTYEVYVKGSGRESDHVIRIQSPTQLPAADRVLEIREPRVRATIMVPSEYIGNMMGLLDERRGVWVRTEYIGPTRVILTYDVPLAEIITDFYDRLKSLSRGHATLDYEMRGFQADRLVKLTILVGGLAVDALSVICHRDIAERRGRALIRKLKDEIPRHLFEVPLQAAIGSRVVARETIRAMRKNVTAKCYGGDITRKRKLIEKQKEGKRRMKSVGSVEIPQEAFLAVLKLDDSK